jgi:hypothetical protein
LRFDKHFTTLQSNSVQFKLQFIAVYIKRRPNTIQSSFNIDNKMAAPSDTASQGSSADGKNRKSSLFSKFSKCASKEDDSPVETQLDADHRHSRTHNIIKSFKRLHPKNKLERGGTLREGSAYSTETIIRQGKSVVGGQPGRSSNGQPGEDEKLHFHAPLELLGDSQMDDIPMSTRTQELYNEKKSARERRRSFRKSEDYLGVQGANPRTGYWDISEATTDSRTSQVSHETKVLRLKAHKLAERNAELQTMLQEVQARLNQKEEEEKKRKMHEKEMQKRRQGKWVVDENAWKSVATPDLTPIEQSIPGTPTRSEYLQLRASHITNPDEHLTETAINSTRMTTAITSPVAKAAIVITSPSSTNTPITTTIGSRTMKLEGAKQIRPNRKGTNIVEEVSTSHYRVKDEDRLVVHHSTPREFYLYQRTLSAMDSTPSIISTVRPTPNTIPAVHRTAAIIPAKDLTANTLSPCLNILPSILLLGVGFLCWCLRKLFIRNRGH